jgi:hypothetical protein
MVRRIKAYRVVACLVGVVLLGTAWLKFDALDTLPTIADPVLSSPRLVIGIIEIEVLLALFLLSGYAPRAASASVLTFFTGAAAINVYSIATHQKGCLCFGRLGGTPQLSLAVDILLFAVLLTWRPRRLHADNSPIRARWPGHAVGAALCASALAAGVALVVNPPQSFLELRGDDLVIEPEIIFAGDGYSGTEKAISFRVTNIGTAPIHLLGLAAPGECLTTEQLPMTLSAGQSCDIAAQFQYVGPPGRFYRAFIVFTDSKKQPVVFGRVVGRVTGAESQ